MPWILIGTLSALGVALLLYGRLRGRSEAPAREPVPDLPIAELREGRYRVVGRVVPLQSARSELDGADCVFLLRTEHVGVGRGGLLGGAFMEGLLTRTARRRQIAHPFLLSDGSGEVLVDPREAWIECATLTEDGGLVTEQRLRVGEEIALVASFRRSQRSLGPGPYRAQVVGFEPYDDDLGPPRISYRTEEGMVWAPRDHLASLAGGIGGILLGMSAFLTFIFGATL